MKCLYCNNEANGTGIYTKLCKDCQKTWEKNPMKDFTDLIDKKTIQGADGLDYNAMLKVPAKEDNDFENLSDKEKIDTLISNLNTMEANKDAWKKQAEEQEKEIKKLKEYIENERIIRKKDVEWW